MYWALCLTLITFLHPALSQTNVTVTTSKGVVIGLRWNPNPNTLASYDAFLGIPYGQVPGRYQPPVPRSSWSTPLTAHEDGPACPQPSNNLVPGVVFSEDCLYLNVFTPVNASLTPGALPVMAFIHGSAFTFGSSTSAFFSPDFLIPQGVVLVTMNYRLGAPGFLSLGTPAAPGNLGLWDTQFALCWIQREISVFGGDPAQVTLAGQSAGSAMTMFHYLSPVSSAMFQRAIAHSGSALASWAHVTSAEARRRAMLLADAVGCDSSTNNTQMLSCLQQVDINTIVNKQNVTLPVGNAASGNLLPFVPVIDTDVGKPAFFPDSIENLMKEAATRSKPLIAGFTAEEGILLFAFGAYKIAESHLSSFIPRSIQTDLSDQQKVSLGKKVESKYFPETVDQNKVLDIVNLFTDYLFAYPTIDVVRQLSNVTYAYVFAYDGTWTPMPNYFSRYQVTGVWHGADLFYLFYGGQDLGKCQSNLPNLAVRDNMVRWWTNFIKDGVPDPTGLWRTASSGHYLLIDSTVSLADASLVEDRHYNFWANLSASDNSSAPQTSNTFVLLILTFSLCIAIKYNL